VIYPRLQSYHLYRCGITYATPAEPVTRIITATLESPLAREVVLLAHASCSALLRSTAPLIGIALLCGRPAAAQDTCKVLCKPTISIEPSVITNHLFSRPTTRTLATGAVQQLPSTTNFEIIFAVGASTPIRRLSLYGSVQWLPNAAGTRNPFTLYGASQIGDKVRANAPTASAGLSLSVVDSRSTDGWVGVDVHVGDLYSAAARPHDSGAYTHKLDLGLVGNWSPFAALPAHTYMHGVLFSTLLDYVATGLPKAGDEVPKGERVFLTGAHSASLIAGLVFPLASK